MFPLYLAARYLRTRLIVAISVAAIAFAVVIAYAPNPVFEGVLTEIKTKVRGTSADVLVETRDDMDAAPLAARAEAIDPRITASAPRIEGTVIFSTGDPVDAFDFGQVIGVEPEREARVNDFGRYLDNAGTPAERPFELKPSTLLAAVRREAAERRAGREAVGVLDEGARRRALKRLAAEGGQRDFSDPAERSRYVDGQAAKYGDTPEVRRRAAERAEEKGAGLLAALEERTGREVFRRLEASEARRRVEAEALPEGAERSAGFRARLEAARGRPGVLVSTTLLEEYKDLRIGGEIELVCGRFTGPMEAQEDPKARNRIAVIAGAYDSGLHDFDVRTLFMARADAESFLEGVKPIRGLGFKLRDWREADSVRDRLAAELNPADYLVTTWRQRREVVLEAVNRQRQVLFVILFFADIVAGFGIFVTLRILVAEKVQDVGILSALGAGPWKVMGAFLLVGLSIGLVGSLLGVAAGTALVGFINEIVDALDRLGFSEFKVYIVDVQHLKRLPVEYSPWTLAQIVLATLASSCVFSLYPAWLASRLKPVDAIRREFL
jgi:lipoprotein-releasing system permease protein